MNITRSIVIILICAAVTFGERTLPFALFRKREVPDVVRYLGKILPMAVIATLVVYCLRGTDFSALCGFVPPLTAAAVTVLLHLWKKSTLLSVAGGTAVYMVLIRMMG